MIAAAMMAAALTCTTSVPPSWGQPGSASRFFEIDGDDGSVISEVASGGGKEVTDGTAPNRHSTLGRRAESSCLDWAHATVARSFPGYPYMGRQMYQVECRATSNVRRRNEQNMLVDWFAGPDGERSFTFAFMFTEPLPTDRRVFISQWHQSEPHAPPVRFHWFNEGGSHRIEAGVRWDSFDASHRLVENYDSLGETPVLRGLWYYFFVQITPGPSGSVDVWLMNNHSGVWVPFASYAGKVGYEWAAPPEGEVRYEPGFGTPAATRLTGDDLDWTWKIGHYVNDEDAVLLYYDNIAYGKRWADISKQGLTGYRKTVLAFDFEADQGSTARDVSYWWNGGEEGHPTTDYDNDGTYHGSPQWPSDGVWGRALRLDGDTHVAVPIHPEAFDFGNYVSVSTWFRTTNHPADNKGLVFVDEYSDTWKVKLYMSDTLLSFGVKYPDNTYTTVNYTFPAGTYADGEWHHVVGTFNRFLPSSRLRLYVDGTQRKVVAGMDKPIQRGESRMTIGKYSVNGYFVGDLDDVVVRNYTMSPAEVSEQYNDACGRCHDSRSSASIGAARATRR